MQVAFANMSVRIKQCLEYFGLKQQWLHCESGSPEEQALTDKAEALVSKIVGRCDLSHLPLSKHLVLHHLVSFLLAAVEVAHVLIWAHPLHSCSAALNHACRVGKVHDHCHCATECVVGSCLITSAVFTKGVDCLVHGFDAGPQWSCMPE